MKYVAPVRSELGIRTIFNILGPLVNPAGANMELLGVYDEDLVEPMAKVLANLGVASALVVYGQDGLDEISLSSATSVCELRGGFIRSYEIRPEDFGFERCNKSELVGGNPEQNAKITRDILAGQPGSKRDAVILNSAAAIYIARPELSMAEAIVIAAEVIDSGAAARQLELFIEFSQGGAGDGSAINNAGGSKGVSTTQSDNAEEEWKVDVGVFAVGLNDSNNSSELTAEGLGNL